MNNMDKFTTMSYSLKSSAFFALCAKPATAPACRRRQLSRNNIDTIPQELVHSIIEYLLNQPRPAAFRDVVSLCLARNNTTASRASASGRALSAFIATYSLTTASLLLSGWTCTAHVPSAHGSNMPRGSAEWLFWSRTPYMHIHISPASLAGSTSLVVAPGVVAIDADVLARTISAAPAPALMIKNHCLANPAFSAIARDTPASQRAQTNGTVYDAAGMVSLSSLIIRRNSAYEFVMGKTPHMVFGNMPTGRSVAQCVQSQTELNNINRSIDERVRGDAPAPEIAHPAIQLAAQVHTLWTQKWSARKEQCVARVARLKASGHRMVQLETGLPDTCPDAWLRGCSCPDCTAARAVYELIGVIV